MTTLLISQNVKLCIKLNNERTRRIYKNELKYKTQLKANTRKDVQFRPKQLINLLKRQTDQTITVIENRNIDIYDVLIHSGDEFLDVPRSDASKPTAREQLQVMKRQPKTATVTYKSKRFNGLPYGRRYAETGSNPALQCMQKQIRAAMSVGQIDIDMKCAHPTIVADILGKACPAPIIEYIGNDNRDKDLKKCMQATGLS